MTNFGLLLMAAILALVAWLQPGLEDDSGVAPLATLDPASVTELVVSRPGLDAIVLEREDGIWMMREPVPIHASEARIDAVLAVLEAPVRAGFPAASVDPANYGLDAPRIQLRVDGVELAFGDTEPIDRRRYVRIQDRIVLIDDQHYVWLHGSVGDFVSRQLLPPGATLEVLELPGMVLRRDGDTASWRVAPADGMSAEEASGLASEWSRAQAIAIESHGLVDNEAPRIRLLLDDGRELEFAVIGDDGDPLFVRADVGLAWRMSEAQAARLLEPSEP
jgi:hypothetical protein